jgi:hypothetical protein
VNLTAKQSEQDGSVPGVSVSQERTANSGALMIHIAPKTSLWRMVDVMIRMSAARSVERILDYQEWLGT